MSRLPQADISSSPALAQSFREIEKTRGFVSNVLRSFAHAPEGLARFSAFGAYGRYDNALNDRERELAILITGRGIPYALAHHQPLGLQAGLSQAQLDAIEAHEVPQGLSEPETALARYAFAFTAMKGVDDATFAELTRHYSPRQVVDIGLVCGYYMALGATIIALNIPPDSHDKTSLGADHHRRTHAAGAAGAPPSKA